MNDIQLLYLSEITRILFVIVVLFYTELPLFIKIILIMISDLFDCGLFKSRYGDKDFCKKEDYQVMDKIIDMVGYFLLLFYMIYNQSINSGLTNLLIILLLYRTVGFILFITTKNSQYLILFPNFFIEFALIFVFFNDYIKLPTNQYTLSLLIVSGIIIIYKFMLEDYLHNSYMN
jgi:hypothetical protein